MMIFQQVNYNESKLDTIYYNIANMQVSDGHFHNEKYILKLLKRMEVCFLGKLDWQNEIISLTSDLMADNHRIESTDFYTDSENSKEFVLVCNSLVKNVYPSVNFWQRKAEIILLNHDFRFTLYDRLFEEELEVPKTWVLDQEIASMQENIQALNF